MRNLKTRLASAGVVVGAMALSVRPAAAWVACGGFYRPPVVVCHPAPCYAGVGVAAVAGFAAGAAVASAAHPTVVVAPQPVVVAPAPVYAPAIGTSVTVLPPGSQRRRSAAFSTTSHQTLGTGRSSAATACTTKSSPRRNRAAPRGARN